MSQRRIALLTSLDLVRSVKNRPVDAYEHDYQLDLFTEAARKRDILLEEVVWDTPGISWSDYDAVLIGTTWDYVQKRDLFYSVMRQIDGQTRLFNDLKTLTFNGDKRYLLALANKGIATIPTRMVNRISPEVVASAFEEFACNQVVVKPVIGAGAWRQVLIACGDLYPVTNILPPAAAFVQPFLPSIQEQGELSILFYDGIYSHGVRKLPKKGEYRIQSSYGGVEKPAQPSMAEMKLGRQALQALDEMPLYARVDMVVGPMGQPLLIELEMIEPYHYVEQGPKCGELLMDALLRRL